MKFVVLDLTLTQSFKIFIECEICFADYSEDENLEPQRQFTTLTLILPLVSHNCFIRATKEGTNGLNVSIDLRKSFLRKSDEFHLKMIF